MELVEQVDGVMTRLLWGGIFSLGVAFTVRLAAINSLRLRTLLRELTPAGRIFMIGAAWACCMAAQCAL